MVRVKRRSLFIDNNEVLQGIRSRTRLSSLLFGQSNYLEDTFFQPDDIHRRSELYVLFRMILKTVTLTRAEFTRITSIQITTSQLKDLKQSIKSKIEEHIFSNPYPNRAYVNREPLRGMKRYPIGEYPDFLMAEYNLIQAVWLAFATHAGDSSISFDGIQRDYQFGTDFTKKLSKATSQFSDDTLRNLLKTFQKFIVEGNPSTEQIIIYRMAIDEVANYALEREISLIRIPSKKGAYYIKHLWFDEAIRGYHIINLLKKCLGFDILQFRPLDDSIFDINSLIKYARHHFRNDPDRKLSIWLEDLVLTDMYSHPLLEYHYTESQVNIMLDGFQKMIELERNVEKSDIERIFNGNEWVYETWYQNAEFDDFLSEFNSRKGILKDPNKGLEVFIYSEYLTAYERFWGYHTTDSFYSLVARLPGLGDYGYPDLYETNFATMFSNVLDNYGTDWEFPPP